MHPRRLSTFDFERLLIELVERLADDYEPELGIGAVVKAIRTARDDIGNVDVEAPDGGIDLIERLARQRLDASRPPALRVPAGDLGAGLVGS